MTYIKINFGGHFEDEFHKAVDQVFHLVRPAFKNYECVWRPNIDVYESAEEIVVLADMAGLNKDELHIEVNRSKMKLAGIRQRGSRKDFIDLYTIALRHRPLRDSMDLYRRKYSTDETSHLLIGLTYFDDADEEPMPKMLTDLSWDEVKRQFRVWAREFSG